MGMNVPDDAYMDIKLGESQVAVLGCLLIEPEVVGEIMTRIRTEDFADPTYKNIFVACSELFNAGKPIDPVTVLNKIGTEYKETLFEIIIRTPTAANWEPYTDILRETAILHRMQKYALDLVNARSLDDAQGVIEKLNNVLCRKSKSEPVGLMQGFTEFWNRHCNGQKVAYLPWGFSQLNEMLYAEPGDYIVLGGLPSTGKTMLAIEFAWQMASRGKRIGIFSLETKDRKLYDRLYTRLGNLDFSHVMRNTLTDDEMKSLLELPPMLERYYCEINSLSQPTVQEIRGISLSRRYDVILIDYLQLMSGPGATRAERVTEISLAIRGLCESTGITVIALSQLTPSNEKSKAPTIENLRESKQIGQDADIAMFLCLEDPDDKKSDRLLVVDKNKQGEVGAVPLAFDGAHMLFTSKSKKYNPTPKKERSRFSELPDGDEQETLDVFKKPEGGSA